MMNVWLLDVLWYDLGWQTLYHDDVIVGPVCDMAVAVFYITEGLDSFTTVLMQKMRVKIVSGFHIYFPNDNYLQDSIPFHRIDHLPYTLLKIRSNEVNFLFYPSTIFMFFNTIAKVILWWMKPYNLRIRTPHIPRHQTDERCWIYRKQS